MRDIELDLETAEDGAQRFRTNAYFSNPAWFMDPTVDGQLATCIRLFREGHFSGDDERLAGHWEAAMRSLRYALENWGQGMRADRRPCPQHL